MAVFADTPASTALAGAALALAEARRLPGLPAGEQLGETNLYAVCELIAARAARASSARQYRCIYIRFCDALREQLGRPPTVGDLGVDVIAAYGRQLERHGGRAGGPASPATRRAHMTMLRALLRELGLEADAAAVRVPSHRLGPPETLTAAQYGNLTRAPDGRTAVGRRDRAILRLMGDCGLRNSELRGLTARAIRRPRSNSRHHHLFIRGKGDVEREVQIPTETLRVLQRWLDVHPRRQANGSLADEQLLFVRLSRDNTVGGLSQQGLAKIVRRYASASDLPERLAHPHALRGFYATTLSAEGMVIQTIKARLGHASIETTARYLAELGGQENSVGEVMDRRHQRQRRERNG